MMMPERELITVQEFWPRHSGDCKWNAIWVDEQGRHLATGLLTCGNRDDAMTEARRDLKRFRTDCQYCGGDGGKHTDDCAGMKPPRPKDSPRLHLSGADLILFDEMQKQGATLQAILETLKSLASTSGVTRCTLNGEPLK